MKIVHICLGSFFIDGYGYQENMITKYHSLMGLDVSVIASLFSFDKSGLPIYLSPQNCYVNENNIKIIRLNYKKPGKLTKTFRAYKGFLKTLEKEIPDIIFIHNFQFFDILKIIKYKKKHPKVRIYVDNHADYYNSASNWISKNIQHKIIYRYYARKIEPFVEKFYGVLPLRCEFLKDIYKLPAEKISYLEMGIDDVQLNSFDRFIIKKSIRTSLGITDEDFVIITGGKIDKKKNIHLLIQAVKNLNISNLKLIVFGTISPMFKIEFENCLKNATNVRFIGWLDSIEINKYLIASDLAVMPGSHSVLWEQVVGCGVPAVFKHFENMHHVDIGGNCKFLYKDSCEEIQDMINQIYNDKFLYDKMRKVAISDKHKVFYYSKISKKAIDF